MLKLSKKHFFSGIIVGEQFKKIKTFIEFEIEQDISKIGKIIKVAKPFLFVVYFWISFSIIDVFVVCPNKSNQNLLNFSLRLPKMTAFQKYFLSLFQSWSIVDTKYFLSFTCRITTWIRERNSLVQHPVRINVTDSLNVNFDVSRIYRHFYDIGYEVSDQFTKIWFTTSGVTRYLAWHSFRVMKINDLNNQLTN